MLSSVYSAGQRGKHMQIQSLLAYDLSLINGCDTCENNIRGHSFFWSAPCKSPILKSLLKKVTKQV